MNKLDRLYREVKRICLGSDRVYTGIITPVDNGARLEMELPDTRIDCLYSSAEMAKNEANNLAAGYGIDESRLLLITVDYGERDFCYG